MGVLYAVTILLLVCAAAAERQSRRRFVRWGGAFRCRIRALGDPPRYWPWLRERWSRRLLAYWCDDVLVVRRGPIVTRAAVLAVRACRDAGNDVPPDRPRWCGARPLVVELTLAGGTRVRVAAHDRVRLDLVGPYLSAALNGLPSAPVPGRRVP